MAISSGVGDLRPVLLSREKKRLIIRLSKMLVVNRQVLLTPVPDPHAVVLDRGASTPGSLGKFFESPTSGEYRFGFSRGVTLLVGGSERGSDSVRSEVRQRGETLYQSLRDKSTHSGAQGWELVGGRPIGNAVVRQQGVRQHSLQKRPVQVDWSLSD